MPKDVGKAKARPNHFFVDIVGDFLSSYYLF